MTTATNRADCFFSDGTYIRVPVLEGDTIPDILILVGEQTQELVVEIQTDAGIWTREEGFKTWEQLEA